MMSLKIQIYSSIFSFLFGIFFSVMLNYCYKKIKIKNKYGNIIFNLGFAIFHTILYYLLLEKVNYGILHPYCVISVIVGFIVAELLYYKVANKHHI